MYTFDVGVWVDGVLVRQVVDDALDAEEAEFAALRLVLERLPNSASVEALPYLTVYMGATAEQTFLMGVA